jgi:hypothetical protein
MPVEMQLAHDDDDEIRATYQQRSMAQRPA